MANGAKRPIGSNKVAILLGKFRFVHFISSPGVFLLKMKASSSASHHTPNVLEHGR